ncbi:MAG: hypothetical protein C0626_02095 [Arcobacter sp.]|uniref:hypothetical protein n=1 Tax=uncultured Arcobacter sp. TaxID=165434 RepID=UPI000CC83B70|nr:hypothetical protein [uncultured Arcobacter sp.]PLY11383.1 MAG: hypothetical protein C0626_02095 [Arcobacter sp.]
MFLLSNYDFLEELVKDGQAIQEPFFKDGFCIADKKVNPNSAYVFIFKDGVIWAKYGWTKHKNKAFLKFHKEVENLIFSFGVPILRIGKNDDFKNHTKYVGILDNQKVFQFKRSY